MAKKKIYNIAIILNSTYVNEDMADILKQFNKNENIMIKMIIINNIGDKNNKNYAYRLLLKVDEIIFSKKKNVNIKGIFTDAYIINYNDETKLNNGLNNFNIDFGLCIGTKIEINRHKFIKKGIFYFGEKDKMLYDNFINIITNKRKCNILVKMETTKKVFLIDRCTIALDRLSAYKSYEKSLLKGMDIMVKSLKEIDDIIKLEATRLDGTEIQNKTTMLSINATKCIFLMQKYLFELIKEKVRRIFEVDQWILLIDLNNKGYKNLPYFKKIIPPLDRFWADPFITVNNNKYYIFFEELLYKEKKGHISVMRMDEYGKYEEPVKVLDKSYHLSYPFIFQYCEEYYMIPESRRNKSIELYKCTNFPYDWKFVANIMTGIEAVDTTVFNYNNKWWLFTSIVEHKGDTSCDKLFLFYADDLIEGKWISHPKNPIISDASKARPAGKIYIQNGILYRPSQECTVSYGYAIKINKISKLNELEYQEEEEECIQPGWDKSIKALHTLNQENNIIIMDCKMARKKDFNFFNIIYNLI